MKYILSALTLILSHLALAQNLKIQISSKSKKYERDIQEKSFEYLSNSIDKNYSNVYIKDNVINVDTTDPESIEDLIEDLNILTNENIRIKIVSPKNLPLGTQDDMT